MLLVSSIVMIYKIIVALTMPDSLRTWQGSSWPKQKAQLVGLMSTFSPITPHRHVTLRQKSSSRSCVLFSLACQDDAAFTPRHLSFLSQVHFHHNGHKKYETTVAMALVARCYLAFDSAQVVYGHV